MSTPRHDVIQVEYTNPHASKPLFIPITVISNTKEGELTERVRINAARDLPWVSAVAEHEKPAVLVGGGPSAADHLSKIAELQAAGGVVYALNGASAWLRSRGVIADYQVIADAKEDTAALVDLEAKAYIFASQVHPKTVDAAAACGTVSLWHHGIDDVEAVFPPERRSMGNYVLLGGGASVGNSALCLAYALGHRSLHLFGFDSCHRDGRAHAYNQPMNDSIPSIEVRWGEKTYQSSVAMKWQAERFQVVAKYLVEIGCQIEVYGDGLLQAMYLTPPADLTERDKYVLMWQFEDYRTFSPGEHLVPKFVELVNPDGMIIDFGCGTGRAGLALDAMGHQVFLIDFTGNCRDHEAIGLPFLQWDLTKPVPMTAPYGFCTDVMEHIPPEDVLKVIGNIMDSSEKVFFQISTVKDDYGQFIGTPLHLTVQQHGWWFDLFETMGYKVTYDMDRGTTSLFVVSRKDNNGKLQ